MNNAIYIDLLMITIFFSYVGAAYHSIKQQKEPLLKLLSQGLIQDLFHSIKYLYLFLSMGIIGIISVMCWRIHECLSMVDALGTSEVILLVFISLFTSYLLLYDTLGKLLLLASRRFLS